MIFIVVKFTIRADQSEVVCFPRQLLSSNAHKARSR
jgi:hypothetical protein